MIHSVFSYSTYQCHLYYIIVNDLFTHSIFSGTGWFLDKVYVKDTKFHKQYVITSNKWLSFKDKDSLTFREFEVNSTMDYDEGEPRRREML